MTQISPPARASIFEVSSSGLAPGDMKAPIIIRTPIASSWVTRPVAISPSISAFAPVTVTSASPSAIGTPMVLSKVKAPVPARAAPATRSDSSVMFRLSGAGVGGSALVSCASIRAGRSILVLPEMSMARSAASRLSAPCGSNSAHTSSFRLNSLSRMVRP